MNGKLLGSTDNMFRRWTWEVGGLLETGENELKIVFRAPVPYIKAKQAVKPLMGGGDIPGGPHLRKAPCQWGWDWGPKLPPIGIWKDIRLEGYSQAKIEDIHIRQTHTDGRVTLAAEVKIEQWSSVDLKITLKVTAPGGEVQHQEGKLSRFGNQAICNLKSEISNPLLWWPNGFGDQPLYKLEVGLESGKTTLDSRSYQVGLRSLKLRQEPDEWGESFTFVVNGVPIFAKGADWIPADSFPTRITDASMERLIRDAAAVHMNMLRVWGGGFYEEERFYDLCDRYGLLIWQDFIFACGVYPEERAFAENVRVEAVENVRRLRHHASLALWCGNNEMEQGWVDWKWNNPDDPLVQRLKAGYDHMFHHLLPEVRGCRGPRPAILAQFGLLRDPVRQPKQPAARGYALLGRLARAQTVQRLSRAVPALHERVRFPGPAALQDHPDLCRTQRPEHDFLHHGAPPALRLGQRTDGRPDDRHLPDAKGFPVAGLPEHGAAGRGHPLRGGTLAPGARAGERHADLAVERLLAGGLLVEY